MPAAEPSARTGNQEQAGEVPVERETEPTAACARQVPAISIQVSVLWLRTCEVHRRRRTACSVSASSQRLDAVCWGGCRGASFVRGSPAASSRLFGVRPPAPPALPPHSHPSPPAAAGPLPFPHRPAPPAACRENPPTACCDLLTCGERTRACLVTFGPTCHSVRHRLHCRVPHTRLAHPQYP